MQAPAAVWPAEWRVEILSITQGTNPLGPDNALIKRISAVPRAAVLATSANLVASLVDPHATPAAAKALLLSMNTLLVDPAKLVNIPAVIQGSGGFVPPSAFPGPSYTAVLECIAAKTLWLNGHTEFLPWPFDDIELKPDFCIRGKSPAAAGHDAATFYSACTEVADSLKVGGNRTVADLLNSLYSGITGKLGTYRQKQVSVILDTCDNPCLYNGLLVNFDGPGLGKALGVKLATELNPELRQQLVSVFLILPDWTVMRLSAALWS